MPNKHIYIIDNKKIYFTNTDVEFNSKLKNLFTICLFISITSCAKYYVNSIRRDNISIQQLRSMDYEIRNTTISYDGRKYRKFAVEEQCLLDEFNKSMVKNFYKKNQTSNNMIMLIDLEILAKIKEEKYVCSSSGSIGVGNFFPRYGLLSSAINLSHRNTDYKTCKRYKTIFDVFVKGFEENSNEILFETNIKYEDDKLYNTNDKIDEIKNILKKITTYVGYNFTDMVSR